MQTARAQKDQNSKQIAALPTFNGGPACVVNSDILVNDAAGIISDR